MRQVTDGTATNFRLLLAMCSPADVIKSRIMAKKVGAVSPFTSPDTEQTCRKDP